MHNIIRILATDLDGTMLHHDNEVSPRNYRAVERAVNEGMLYVVATGRCRSIVPFSKLPLPDYLISENGAVIYRGGTEKVLYCQPVAAEQLRAAVRIGKKYHAFVELVSDGRIVVEKQLLSQAGQLHLTKIQEDFLREKRYLTVDSFEKYCDKIQKNQEGEEPFGGPQVTKINIICQDAEGWQGAEKELEACGCFTITSDGYGLELTKKGVSKGSAMKWLCSFLNLELSNVMAFGDGSNDAVLLKHAGIGVAMDNAGEAVKQCADYVTGSNYEDGVAQFVEQYVLKQAI